MNGLTRLGTVLTVVFLVSILVLVAELIYVLWRRRVFRRRTDQELPSDPFYMMAWKERLLYFFCLKNRSRVEPAGIAPVSEPPSASEVVLDDELAKWQHGMYGPSRVLFTIKEEEREGTETETENETSRSKTVRSEEAESFSEVEVMIIRVVEEEDAEATPFSTPCASPPYYTPSPSPTRDKYSPGKCENDVSHVSLQFSGD